MTDEERTEAIEDFLNYADREGWALRRRVFPRDPLLERPEASERDLARLIEDHLLRRVR